MAARLRLELAARFCAAGLERSKLFSPSEEDEMGAQVGGLWTPRLPKVGCPRMTESKLRVWDVPVLCRTDPVGSSPDLMIVKAPPRKPWHLGRGKKDRVNEVVQAFFAPSDPFASDSQTSKIHQTQGSGWMDANIRFRSKKVKYVKRQRPSARSRRVQ